MLIGYVLAVLGAIGSGAGSVLESLGVRKAGAYGGNRSDLSKVARQPIYWIGILVDIAGFFSAAVALHRLPLFLVQSVLAFSVGITALISRAMGISMPKPGWWALGFSAVGLVTLGLSAQPGPAEPLPAVWRVGLLFVAVVVGVIVLFAPRISRPSLRTVATAFGAGLGFAAVAISARTLPPVHELADVLGEPAAWAIVVNGFVAMIAFARALQLGSATAVSAVLFTTNTVVPATIGFLVLDDRIREGFVAAAAIGFILAIGGAVTVAHFSSHAEAPTPDPELVDDPR
jgi:drug/metabolite transporter (DMT)-like permease